MVCCFDFDIGWRAQQDASYSIQYRQVIAVEDQLVQVLPAAIFFTVFSILGTSYNSYHDIMQIRDMYQQKYHHVLLTKSAWCGTF